MSLVCLVLSPLLWMRWSMWPKRWRDWEWPHHCWLEEPPHQSIAYLQSQSSNSELDTMNFSTRFKPNLVEKFKSKVTCRRCTNSRPHILSRGEFKVPNENGRKNLQKPCRPDRKYSPGFSCSTFCPVTAWFFYVCVQFILIMWTIYRLSFRGKKERKFD